MLVPQLVVPPTCVALKANLSLPAVLRAEGVDVDLALVVGGAGDLDDALAVVADDEGPLRAGRDAVEAGVDLEAGLRPRSRSTLSS